ncbi:MAG: hypothetical protein GY861_03320 [bacterium]|nr:hypothetical protein [bacterium]
MDTPDIIPGQFAVHEKRATAYKPHSTYVSPKNNNKSSIKENVTTKPTTSLKDFSFEEYRRQCERTETKQKELKAREKLLESRESEVEEQELLVDRDKKANRIKQEDNELRAKSIKKKQAQLQKMIDAQKL